MWQDIVNKIRTGGRGPLLIGALAVLILIVIIWQAATGKQRALAASLENFVKTQTYHVDAQLVMDLPTQQNRQQPLVSVTFDVNGDVQEQENGQPVFAGTMRSEARGRGMVLFADGQIDLLPNAVAFRLDNLPTLLNPKGNLVEKWTYVDVPPLQTNNADAVRNAFEGLVKHADYVGRGNGDQAKLNQYRVPVSSEDESNLIEVFRQAHSGNRALHVVTRLLRAYDVGSLNVWIDSDKKQLRRVEAVFGVIQDNSFDDRATLTLSFSDYGKKVIIETPPKELTVRPDVFSRIFGTGEIEQIGQ